MNLKLRFQNKVTLTAIIVCVIGFIYQMLGFFGITPSISESMIVELAGIIINILVAFGIVVDPTTAGARDTTQVMDYEQPRVETFDDGDPEVDPEVEIYDEETPQYDDMYITAGTINGEKIIAENEDTELDKG